MSVNADDLMERLGEVVVSNGQMIRREQILRRQRLQK
jgi:hypothetical protein